MTYVSPDYKSKKQLREAILRGDDVKVFQPGLGTIPKTGIVYLEGPHYPKPHSWYAEGAMINGKLVGVK